MANTSTVDDYIAAQSAAVQARLQQLHQLVLQIAPMAQPCISYGMPCYTYQGPLVYFGAFRRHIGMYPPVREPGLLDEVKPYAGPKGNLRFPLDQPLPLQLIERIIRARLAQMSAHANAQVLTQGDPA